MDLAADRVGQAAGQQLVQDHAQRVHVAARVELERIGEHLLGAHVGERADELPDVGLQRRLRVAVGDARHAEVEDLRLPGFVDQDVARLQVAVDDAALVRVVDRVADLRHQLQPLARVQMMLLRRKP